MYRKATRRRGEEVSKIPPRFDASSSQESSLGILAWVLEREVLREMGGSVLRKGLFP